VRPTWEPDGYLEGDSYVGLPYVPEASVPDARRAVSLAIKHAETGLTPVGELPDAKEVLARLIGTVRASKNAARMTEEEGKIRMAVMRQELADIPLDILRDAMMQVRLSGDERDDWFPTGGRIRAAAAPELAKRKLRMMRLQEWQRDLERRAKAQEEANKPLTDEERAELEMLKQRRSNAGYVPDPNSPPPGIDQATWAEMLAKAKSAKR